MNNGSQRLQPGDVLVMVGTRKGAFLFWSDPARRTWRHSHHHGDWSVHALNYDERSGSIYAATNNNYLDERTVIQRSADGGAVWLEAARNPAFDNGRQAWQIWQVVPGHPQRPGEMWAGTREAGLFRSRDSGETWASVAGLNDHPTHATWEEGGGGLLLHTILLDPENPNRLYACISMGGAFRSEDGGASWQPINRGVADGLPHVKPGTEKCVHKMALHPARPAVLFQQHHTGVYRSDDRGDTWSDISAGLPSRFGFPLVLHPHDPNTVYVVPHVSDRLRVVPEGRMAVWRSRNGGNNWEGLSVGLPDNAWLTCLRESLAVDSCDPAGVYVGTSTGQVFHSRNEGANWEVLADYLPGVVSVNAARLVG
ncbi:MAG: hypothetical protein KJZ53_07770 [Anaerolineales bacterium]|nr:hypothetical protein [Anaerolineales bacterium]